MGIVWDGTQWIAFVGRWNQECNRGQQGGWVWKKKCVIALGNSKGDEGTEGMWAT